MSLHGARRDEKPCGNVLVRQTIADQPHHILLGGRQRSPTTGWAFSFTSTALRVGDCLLGGQRRALSPGVVEIMLAHSFSQRGHRGFVTRLMDFEPHSSGVMAERLRGAEKPRGLWSVSVSRQVGEELQSVGEVEVNAAPHCAREGVVGV